MPFNIIDIFVSEMMCNVNKYKQLFFIIKNMEVCFFRYLMIIIIFSIILYFFWSSDEREKVQGNTWLSML